MDVLLTVAMALTLGCAIRVVFRGQRSHSRTTTFTEQVLTKNETSLALDMVYILLGVAGLLYCLHTAAPEWFEMILSY